MLQFATLSVETQRSAAEGRGRGTKPPVNAPRSNHWPEDRRPPAAKLCVRAVCFERWPSPSAVVDIQLLRATDLVEPSAWQQLPGWLDRQGRARIIFSSAAADIIVATPRLLAAPAYLVGHFSQAAAH